MHISSHLLRLALLRVFAEAGVRAGDWLSFSEMGERWRITGLRASDLLAATRDLEESGDLIKMERDRALLFTLSESAHRDLGRHDGELQKVSSEDQSDLFDASYRPRTGHSPSLRRRVEDMAEQTQQYEDRPESRAGRP
jgi:hypothetical protein